MFITYIVAVTLTYKPRLQLVETVIERLTDEPKKQLSREAHSSFYIASLPW